MNCPKCNAEIEDGAVFCGNCGYDISSDNIMNTLEENASKTEQKKKALKLKKKNKTEEEPAKKTNWKLIAVIVIIIVIAAAIGAAILLLGSTEGEKVLKNVPIGRDIAYAETKTDKDFTTVSKYDAMKDINSFDSICESLTGIKIEGTYLPEWAVAVSTASDGTIDRVTYYDFSQLHKTWKGYRAKGEIKTTEIEYGMSEKAVERKLGFKPYTIIKDIDNTSTYVYRYYYSDDVTGNDVVVNYSVVFNDIDGNVKNVYTSTIDYNGFMFSAE